jgi:probable rRNA maturation factor
VRKNTQNARKGGELSLRSRQHARKIDLRYLRKIILAFLEELLCVSDFELGVLIVAGKEMALVNEQFLQHTGSTDVITFNYRERPSKESIRGDIYVCIEDALAQSKEFATSWQAELVRYIVHGVLHLLGYDDRTAGLRRTMKRAEEKLLAELKARFALRSVGTAPIRHG